MQSKPVEDAVYYDWATVSHLNPIVEATQSENSDVKCWNNSYFFS